VPRWLPHEYVMYTSPSGVSTKSMSLLLMSVAFLMKPSIGAVKFVKYSGLLERGGEPLSASTLPLKSSMGFACELSHVVRSRDRTTQVP
jgi:hypothetical protein